MRIRRIVKKRIIAVALSLCLVAGCMSRPIISRADIEETKQQIEDTEKEKEQLENEQAENQDNIESLKDEKSQLSSELSSLNTQFSEISAKLSEIEDQIEAKQAEIEAKQAEIEQTKLDLEEAIETEESQYAAMVKRVREMYEQGEVNFLSALLSATSISDMLTMADYFEKIEQYDQKKLTEFKETRASVEETKARLETEEQELQNEMAELDQLKIDAESQKSKISGLISQTQNAYNKNSSQLSDAEQKAADYEAQIAERESDLTYLKAKLAEEIALSQKASNSSWRDISEVTFDSGDRYLLANLIYCEAGGEPYEGQVAVGAVVINRVLSSVFPDTVTGVIYQANQFTPAGSGRLAIALSQNLATASCYQAADAAMSGTTNVGNCVFFRTPIDGLTGISIGGHIFY